MTKRVICNGHMYIAYASESRLKEDLDHISCCQKLRKGMRGNRGERVSDTRDQEQSPSKVDITNHIRCPLR